MLFSSYIFIFIFLPVTIISYFIIGRFSKTFLYQKFLLVISSIVFYAYFSIKYLCVLLFSLILNYLFSYLIYKYKKKYIFSIVVVFNILVLCFFKYNDFFISSLNYFFRANIIVTFILPLGISFYVFQQVQYLLELYRQNDTPKSLLDYSLFVLFFPQLLQGPILINKDFFPQLSENSKKANFDSIAAGVFLFSIGLFKKTVVADTLAIFVDNGFGITNPSFCLSWIISFCYTFQLYFDFSGYSDMAVGIAKMMNFELPYNFDSPYKSVSVTMFWRKWHITLGSTLRNLIYIPLGGNRKGYIRTLINLFVTFLVSGFWHGDDLTFIVWGVGYGVLIVFEKIFMKALERIPYLIRIILTFLIVNLLWVLFRADTFNVALDIYRGMLGFNNFSIHLADFSKLAFDSIVSFPSILDFLYISFILLACFIVVFTSQNSNVMFETFKPCTRSLCFSIILFSISILTLSRGGVFLYFNF